MGLSFRDTMERSGLHTGIVAVIVVVVVVVVITIAFIKRSIGRDY